MSIIVPVGSNEAKLVPSDPISPPSQFIPDNQNNLVVQVVRVP